MTKGELRTLYKMKRSALTEAEVARMEDLLLIKFQQLNLPFLNCVHTYLPIDNSKEPDPHSIVRWLSFKNPGLVCAAPVADFGSLEMRHVVYNDDTEVELNTYGIPQPISGEELEPADFDLVFAPLLAFDLRGFRVGYGKGFYDRFLSKCRKDVFVVGLSFFDPVEQITDTNTFDHRMDYCITPDRIYEF